MLKPEYVIRKFLQKLSNKYTFITAKKISTNPINAEVNKNLKKERNRDNLLIGSKLYGRYRLQLHTCMVYSDHYAVENKSYMSLSKAASAITGTYTDGWQFWKIEDYGSSVLEVFRQSMEKI